MGERLLLELHSRFRDEFLNGEVFSALREARILIERCRRHYNIVRPHSSLRYRSPMPESVLPTGRPCTNNQIRPFGAHTHGDPTLIRLRLAVDCSGLPWCAFLRGGMTATTSWADGIVAFADIKGAISGDGGDLVGQYQCVTDISGGKLGRA